MKTRTKYGFLAVSIFGGLAILIGPPAYRQVAWIHAYGEAEPLVEVIWPMAYEMKRFSEEHGRPPGGLEEITRYAPGGNFSRLNAYPHEFTPNGPRRFFLRVNSRFAFVIDDQFTPAWSQPTNVLSKSTNPE